MDGGAHPSTVAVPVYVGQVNRIMPAKYHFKMLLVFDIYPCLTNSI